MSRTDGGSAFPRPIYVVNDTAFESEIPGMSLRDYFAGQVIPALLQSHFLESTAETADELGIGTTETIAFLAYTYADAMLAERARTGAQT